MYIDNSKHKFLTVTAMDKDGNVIYVRRENLVTHNLLPAEGHIYIPSSQQVDTPAITPGTGWIGYDTELEIATSTEGATIHYTTDGTVPSVESPEYTGPFKAEGAECVKAIAVKAGMQDSAVKSEVYRYKVSSGITVEKPEAVAYYEIELSVQGAEYDLYGAPKHFSLDVFDGDGNEVDAAELNATFDWYVDGVLYKESGSLEEDIIFGDDNMHAITVIASIDGLEVSDNVSAKVNNIGPAGGYVFYDKGSYSDGWRYLEAAPADLRVIDGTPTVDVSATGYQAAPAVYIAGYFLNQYNNPTLVGTSKDIGKGMSNTESIYNAIGETTRDYTFSTVLFFPATGDYAARLCAILEHGGYDDWFLPSFEELKVMYNNLSSKGIGGFSGTYWSSSEYNNYNIYHLGMLNYSYQIGEMQRYREYYVRPCRAF